jgi:hypothetical protein
MPGRGSRNSPKISATPPPKQHFRIAIVFADSRDTVSRSIRDGIPLVAVADLQFPSQWKEQIHVQ